MVKDLISYLVAQKTTFQLEGFRDLELCEPLDEEKYTAQIKDNMKNAPFEIREYQDRAVRAALKYHRGILLSCTSSGKSLMLYNIIKSIRAQNYKKILLIVPNIMLVDQMFDDFKSYGWQQIEDEVERLGGGHEATFDCPVLISTWQSLQNKEEEFFEPFDGVFVDECVSENTLIRTPEGDKKITDIKVGDLVLSYNTKTGEFENKKVLETFINHTSSKSAKMLKIELENGRILELTENHPVLTTNRGWVKAGELTENDDLKLNDYDLYSKISELNDKDQTKLTTSIIKYKSVNAFNKCPILDKALYEKYYLKDSKLYNKIKGKLNAMFGGNHKGHIPWNKGKTKETDTIVNNIAKKLSKRNKLNDPKIAKRTNETKIGENNPISKKNYKGNRKKLNENFQKYINKIF